MEKGKQGSFAFFAFFAVGCGGEVTFSASLAFLAVE